MSLYVRATCIYIYTIACFSFFVATYKRFIDLYVFMFLSFLHVVTSSTGAREASEASERAKRVSAASGVSEASVRGASRASKSVLGV